MDSYGLGLILDFQDNASSKMNNATNSFNGLSDSADNLVNSMNKSSTDLYFMASSLSQVGSSISEIGESIISTFVGVSKTVIGTGGVFAGYRMQLKALYGELNAEQVLGDMKEYAETSVFGIHDLINSITMMKVVGIEAMSDVTTSSGAYTQKLMDYASDLAAMMPNLRNVYGVGVSAAMGAFKEYIAEGNAMTLRRSASLDILQLLGEDKGANIEERTRQVADLIEQLNIAGYTASLMGTPTQIVSNLADYWVNFLAGIADMGAYEGYANALSRINDFVLELISNTERYNTISKLVSDVVMASLDVLNNLLTVVMELVDWIIEWASNNPELAKTLLAVVASLGGVLFLAGKFMSATGGILLFLASLKYLGLWGIGTRTLFATLISMTAKLVPLIALGTLLYQAWDRNWLGIRDKINDLFQTVNLIMGYFSGEDGFSEEQYDLAKSMGILSLIENLVILRYYWDYFIEGFKQGIEDVLGFFGGIVEGVGSFLTMLSEATGIDLVSGFESLIKTITEKDLEEKWKTFGETLAEIIAFVITGIAIFKAFTIAVSAVKIIGTIITVVTTVMRGLGIALGFLSANPILLIIAGVLLLAFTIYKHWDEIKAFFGRTVEAIKLFFSNLKESIMEKFNALPENVQNVLIKLKDGIKQAISSITNVLTAPFRGAFAIIEKLFGIDLTDIFSRVGKKIGDVWSSIFGDKSKASDVVKQEPYKPGKVPLAASGVDNFVGGLIQVHEKGGELIDLPRGSRVIPHDESVRESLQDGVSIGIQSVAEYLKQLKLSNQGSSTQSYVDSRVTFAQGSIVIQLMNASEQELEKAAEKLMKIIERKQQLRAMAVRSGV